MHSGGMFLILVLSGRSLPAVHAGSKKWQNASKLVSVVLVIAGAGLAFIALVGGNGGPRWSGLVISSITSCIAMWYQLTRREAVQAQHETCKCQKLCFTRWSFLP